MGLFNLFSKNQGPSPAQEHLDAAKAAHETGESQAALGHLSRGFNADVQFVPLYELAQTILQKLGAAEEAGLFQNAAQQLKSYDFFFKLGDHFFRVGYYVLAIPFFRQALQLRPGDLMAAHDLALALARRFDISGALAVIESVNYTGDYWVFWFHAKLNLFLNKRNEVAVAVRSLEGALSDVPPEADLHAPRQKVAELKASFLRLETIPEPQNHIRDWHFALYGSMIFDFFEVEDQYVAGGRYVAVFPTAEMIRSVFERIKLFLAQAGKKKERVCFIPDRDSEITGRALAKVLGLPAEPYHPRDPQADAIIVGATNSAFNQSEELVNITRNQWTFALNHDWLSPSWICPDAIGFMSQTCIFPWQGGQFKMGESPGNAPEQTPPDHRPADLIAAEIASASFDLAEAKSYLPFYLERKDRLKGIGNIAGAERQNFMIESPVPGAFFGN